MAAIAELSDAPRTMVWVADESDHCTGFNNAWLLWRGSGLQDECAAGWREAICAADRPWVSALHIEHLRRQRPFASAFQMNRADGTGRLVVGGAAPWYAPDGQFAGTVGACLDVERVHHDRHASQAIEAFYRGVLDALNEGTLTCGRDIAGDVCIEWSPLVGTSRGAGLLRLARFADTHGLARPQEAVDADAFTHAVHQRRRRRSLHDGRTAVATFELQPVQAPGDRFGHTSADDLLSVISGRMVETVRRGDLVGQVSEHTIAVLLDGVDDLACAEGVAETIREAACRPVRLAGATFLPEVRVDVQISSARDDAQSLSASA